MDSLEKEFDGELKKVQDEVSIKCMIDQCNDMSHTYLGDDETSDPLTILHKWYHKWYADELESEEEDGEEDGGEVDGEKDDKKEEDNGEDKVKEEEEEDSDEEYCYDFYGMDWSWDDAKDKNNVVKIVEQQMFLDRMLHKHDLQQLVDLDLGGRSYKRLKKRYEEQRQQLIKSEDRVDELEPQVQDLQNENKHLKEQYKQLRIKFARLHRACSLSYQDDDRNTLRHYMKLIDLLKYADMVKKRPSNVEKLCNELVQIQQTIRYIDLTAALSLPTDHVRALRHAIDTAKQRIVDSLQKLMETQEVKDKLEARGPVTCKITKHQRERQRISDQLTNLMYSLQDDKTSLNELCDSVLGK
jgi:hypothetical protein